MGAVSTCSPVLSASVTDFSDPVWCMSMPVWPLRNDWKIWLYPSAGALGGADLSTR